nr:hypothetical protein [Tanacetum cinerariifolium]
MLTDQIDWANLEGDQVRIDINKPLPLSGPPGHVTIQTQFFFNHNLDYLLYGNKGSEHALSISKMKAARYLDSGLELLVPKKMWINEVCTYDISTSYGNNERKIMRFNEIYKFSDGRLTNIMEALDYRVKEYKNIQVIPKYHIEDGNPARANIKQALGRSDTYTGNPVKEILLKIESTALLVQVKMEMKIPHSSGVYFITACPYSTNTSTVLMKIQVYASKLPQF